jgi:hypothetical protein
MAAGNSHHAEQQHLLHSVTDPAGIAPVLHARRQHARQAQPPVCLPQKQQTAIGGNRTAIEVRGHLLAANGWKIEGKKACLIQKPAFSDWKPLPATPFMAGSGGGRVVKSLVD